MLAASLPHRVYTSLKDLGLQLLPSYEPSHHQMGAAIPKTKILVAYSGGMDSTMLLDSLAQLRAQFHLELYAAFYNHQWRPGAPKELPILHKTTEALQIPLIIIEADRTLAKTETVARAHRYHGLTRLAKDLGAHAIVTAHHADDQIETVLFRILRGTGLDGLVGIQRDIAYELPVDDATPAVAGNSPESAVHVLRPLLGVAKADIIEYVSERQLRYFDDPSNDNTKIQRNLIRKKILPELQQHFPQVKNALYKIALLAEGDHEIIEKSLDDLWKSLYLSDEKGYYLNATLFNQIELPYQRRVLKRFFERHQVEVDFQVIEDALLFIRGEHRKDLSIGLKSIAHHKDAIQQGEKKIAEHYFLSLYKNRLRVLHMPSSALASLQDKQRDMVSATVPIPGTATSETLGVTIDISEIAEESKAKLSKPAVLKASALLDPNVAYVDLSLFIDGPDKPEAPKPLELRTRRIGDKFYPMGMSAPMRLKKYLINKGIPRFERDSLPLLASGDHVLWIPGHALSDYVKVSGKPTHRIQLEYAKARPGLSDLSLHWDNANTGFDNQGDTEEALEENQSAYRAAVLMDRDMLPGMNDSENDRDELSFSDEDDEDDEFIEFTGRAESSVASGRSEDDREERGFSRSGDRRLNEDDDYETLED
ncbi:MAG: tRNA lysidine(34) synthetase TilS [Vampirovibrionales bacterium]|nr:tRNA lysidine(34) synthetase TilS [Vampirovibrionales bacterium]